MSDFTEEFQFTPRKSGTGLVAEGDWHGDEITVHAIVTRGGSEETAVSVLETLYRYWKAWSADLIEAIENDHGDPGDFWIEAISAYDGDEDEGYFEIEFSAPDLFEEELAMAVGTLRRGFDEVGLAG